MKKSQKPILVKQLTASAKNAKSVTFIDYQGMGNSQLGALRKQLRKVGGEMLVTKNTLIKRALSNLENSNSLESLSFEGPTAIVFANDDEIAPLQILGKLAKETNLPKLKFGIFNQSIVDKAQLTVLSVLPNKNVLRANLVSALSAPSYLLVAALQGNLQKLVYLLGERSKKIA